MSCKSRSQGFLLLSCSLRFRCVLLLEACFSFVHSFCCCVFVFARAGQYIVEYTQPPASNQTDDYFPSSSSSSTAAASHLTAKRTSFDSDCIGCADWIDDALVSISVCMHAMRSSVFSCLDYKSWQFFQPVLLPDVHALLACPRSCSLLCLFLVCLFIISYPIEVLEGCLFIDRKPAHTTRCISRGLFLSSFSYCACMCVFCVLFGNVWIVRLDFCGCPINAWQTVSACMCFGFEHSIWLKYSHFLRAHKYMKKQHEYVWFSNIHECIHALSFHILFGSNCFYEIERWTIWFGTSQRLLLISSSSLFSFFFELLAHVCCWLYLPDKPKLVP